MRSAVAGPGGAQAQAAGILAICFFDGDMPIFPCTRSVPTVKLCLFFGHRTSTPHA
jgi:hypothetical protein